MLSNGSSRRISTTHHHHQQQQLLALGKKYPDVLFDVISTLCIISILAHRDDIVTLLSTKYPDVYSEIIIASSNDTTGGSEGCQKFRIFFLLFTTNGSYYRR